MTSTKDELRSKLRNSRKDFVLARGTPLFPLSATSRCNLFRCIDGFSVVAGYLPVGSEADPADLLAFALENGARTALPFVDSKDDPIVFRRWEQNQALCRSPLGFQQPLPDAEPVSPTVILAPLVGFDRALNRLGQGAGHYDRAFAAHPEALRIGIAWSIQEVAALPVDPWDLPLDAVITEKEWITGQKSQNLGSG
jgi:5-formyltetrahydrofolate cyclo-ligase